MSKRKSSFSAIERPKRHRINDDQSSQGDMEIEDDEITPALNQPNPRQTTEQPVQQDGEFSDDDDDDDDDDDIDIDNTPNQLNLKERHGFSYAGILHSIRLDRFMSHECFECPLGPNVNIVNGANGSGKSAIVAALQIGLGARPSATERGSKLEEHIKHDRDSAIISIRILNQKPPTGDNGRPKDADMTFKHEVYGDLITIERRLQRGKNSSSWSVKGRRRRITLSEGQTPRKEAMEICDHFGFMVDNPVSILTQTKSKAFLATGKPAEHYKLYRAATLLGPLEDELKKTSNVKDQVADLLKTRKKQLPTVQKELQKLEAAHEQAQQMRNIDRLISEAELRLAWTEVQEEEIKLQKYEDKTASDFQPGAERARIAIEKAKEKLDDLKSVQQIHTNETTKKTERVQVLTANVRNAQKTDKKTELELNRRKRNLEEYDAEISALNERTIEAEDRKERAREEHFAGQEKKTRVIQQIRDIEEDEKNRLVDIATARENETKALDEKMSLEDEIRRTRSEQHRLRTEFDNKRRQHLQVSSAMKSKDNLTRFGQNFPELCRRIRENERRFSYPPVGPLGQYVKLQDESWAAAIELALGRAVLQCFIVNNSRDASFLQRLIPQGGPRPTIVVADLNRARYDIRVEDMPDIQQYGHKTILESVDIQHNAVFNALVDQAYIERNVLNDKDSDITRLGWSHMPNLHTVWNKQGERAYVRNGSNTFRKAPRNYMAQFLTTDMRPYLQSLQREIDNMKGELNQSDSNIRRSQSRLDEIINKIESLRRQVRGWNQESNRAQQKKVSLEDALSRAENAFDPEPFDREINNIENDKVEQEKAAVNCRREIESLEQQRNEFNVELRRATDEYRVARAEVTSLTKKLDEVQNEIAKVRSRMRRLENDKAQHDDKLARAHREIEHQKTIVAEKMGMARSFGECPANVNSRELSSEQAGLKVNSLKKRRDTERQRRGGKTAQQIEAEFLRAKKKNQENKQVLTRVEFYFSALSSGIQHRRDLLRSLNRNLKKMVRANFIQFLQARGHYGSIIFNRDNDIHQLHISARMATHKKADGELHETKDLRSLSGGERSYTTLCFMLALAEICQNPVRVMDEIDVFQDETNRRVSFKTMIEYFNQYLPHRQIIIITPLSLPNVNPTPATRIHKLKPPRDRDSSRRQTLIDQYADN